MFHTFQEERDETSIVSHHKTEPTKANVSFIRDNVCIKVLAQLCNNGFAKCRGCANENCIINKI